MVSYGITFACKFDFVQSENIKLRIKKITPVSMISFHLPQNTFLAVKYTI